MKIVVHLVMVFLLVCLMGPRLVQAGGDTGNAYEIGEKYFARKDYKTALGHYRKALEKNDARAHYRIGLMYEDAGKYGDALSHYRLFVDLRGADAQSSDATLRIRALEERAARKTTRPVELLEQGKILFKKKNYREAERVLLQAAAQDDSKPEIHFYLGEVYMGLEAYGKAASEYNKAKGYY